MKNWPNWCAPNRPYPKTGGRVENLVSGFKGPKCEAIAKGTGEKCRKPAMMFSCFCQTHGGMSWRRKRIERHAQRGKPIIVDTDSKIAMRFKRKLRQDDGINDD